MKLLTLETGAYQANCYVCDCGDGVAVIIDPGDDAGRIRAALLEAKVTPEAILLTHGHLDHISALPELLAVWPVPVYLAAGDARFAFTAQNEIPCYQPVGMVPEKLKDLTDGQTLTFGSATVTVLATPGHSPGSVCFQVKDGETDVLFSGDTLFAGSIGRTDFPGGDNAAMGKSLRRLAALPPALPVYPGHGPATSIGRECRVNPFLQVLDLA